MEDTLLATTWVAQARERDLDPLAAATIVIAFSLRRLSPDAAASALAAVVDQIEKNLAVFRLRNTVPVGKVGPHAT